jgi:hypothetical protein
MKVLLLNSANYGDMQNVNFPVEVEATEAEATEAEALGCYVKGSELLRVGATQTKEDPWDEDFDYYFSHFRNQFVKINQD